VFNSFQAPIPYLNVRLKLDELGGGTELGGGALQPAVPRRAAIRTKTIIICLLFTYNLNILLF